MSRPLRIQFAGASYHVMGRGLEKRRIFRSSKDHEDFYQRLYEARVRFGLKIFSFCLMPNHYHLFIKTSKPNLSMAMRHINASYTTYFNKAHKRCGPLFQGRYKAVLVHEEAYALKLSKYIHLNPVKAKLVTHCRDYSHSSYRYFGHNAKAPDYLDTTWIRKCFQDAPAQKDAAEQYKKYIDSDKDMRWNPVESLKKGTLLGDDRFCQAIIENYLPKKKDGQGISNLRSLQKTQDLAKYRNLIIPHQVSEGMRDKLLAHLLRKFTPLSLREIGEQLNPGRKLDAVSKMIQRFHRERFMNKSLNRLTSDLEKEIMSNVQT